MIRGDRGLLPAAEHELQQQESDPVYDMLCCGYSNELQYRATLGVNWNIGAFSTNVYGVRNARTWNATGEERNIGPWTTWNATLNYRINKLASVLLTANNLTNERPPVDSTNGNWPYYDQGVYNAFGRSMFVELSLDFQ